MLGRMLGWCIVCLGDVLYVRVVYCMLGCTVYCMLGRCIVC